jgi:hypothetical protein
MKIKATLEDLLTKHPQVALRHENGDLLLAAARELGDSASLRLLHAREALAAINPDSEHEWNLAADEVVAAEAAFVQTHAQTEVEL